MKFHHATKIVLFVLAVMLIADVVFVIIEYPKLKTGAPQPLQNLGVQTNPKGTCSPDLADCKGNAQLCMTENKNQVCD